MRGTQMKKTLFILAICSFFVGLDSIITAPLLPLMAESTGTPKELGALYVTAYALAYMISAPFFGAASDRYGRKKLILLGTLVLAAGTFLTGLGNNFLVLLLFRAITGLGAGILQPNIFAMIADKVPYEQRGRAVGIIMGALIGSTLFGVPAGTYLAYAASWQLTFFIIGLLALLLALLVLALPQDTAKEAAGAPVQLMMAQLRSAFSHSSVFFALLSTFLWFGGLQVLFPNIGLYYDRFELNVSQIGLVLMAAGAGSVIGSLIGGKLADRFGKKRIAGLAGISTAFFVLAVTLVDGDVKLAIALHILWATAFGFGEAALTALISELKPQIRGTVLSLNASAMYAGMMAASALSTVLLQTEGFTGIGMVSALATCLIMPITHYLVKEQGAAAAEKFN